MTSSLQHLLHLARVCLKGEWQNLSLCQHLQPLQHLSLPPAPAASGRGGLGKGELQYLHLHLWDLQHLRRLQPQQLARWSSSREVAAALQRRGPLRSRRKLIPMKVCLCPTLMILVSLRLMGGRKVKEKSFARGLCRRPNLPWWNGRRSVTFFTSKFDQSWVSFSRSQAVMRRRVHPQIHKSFWIIMTL